MSNPTLPPETIDHIVDMLHDTPKTLRNCSLVAKSWVPRTRMHLFADIKFSSSKVLESWKKTFPDPSNSPAFYTLTLSVNCYWAMRAADTEEDGWIRAFSRIVRLDLERYASGVSLPLFHESSPVLKSLRLTYSRQDSYILDFVCSFPLLEDLTLISRDYAEWDLPLTIKPSTSPPLTGTLQLSAFEGAETIVRKLLDLPNGAHFRKLVLPHRDREDFHWVRELVVGCSETLKCIDMTYPYPRSDDPTPVSTDLSKATKLEEVIFQQLSLEVGWITLALRTITPNQRDLRRISIEVPTSLPHPRTKKRIGQEIYGQWLELDHILVQLWESHSIRLRFTRKTWGQKFQNTMEDCLGYLLPEATKIGMIDVVDRP